MQLFCKRQKLDKNVMFLEQMSSTCKTLIILIIKKCNNLNVEYIPIHLVLLLWCKHHKLLTKDAQIVFTQNWMQYHSNEAELSVLNY